MSLLPDPSELLALADRIGDQATAVRARAHHLGHASTGTIWTGLAADAFELEAGDVIAALRGAAARLDAAAEALRRHAANVRHAVDVLRVLEHQALGMIHSAEHGIHDGINRGVDDVAHLAHLVGV